MVTLQTLMACMGRESLIVQEGEDGQGHTRKTDIHAMEEKEMVW